jgi:hypothetical protein
VNGDEIVYKGTHGSFLELGLSRLCAASKLHFKRFSLNKGYCTFTMKLATVFITLAPVALALPASDGTLNRRQTSLSVITDQLLFRTTLPDFISRRNAKNPSTLDWTSDGCTSSPDNPFGFPFVPACNRHDFGYQNYRLQSRFTDSGKLNIDNNFKSE